MNLNDTEFKTFEYCQFREEIKPNKINYNDDYYPSFAWGKCLPGDEGGILCSKSKELCDYDESLMLNQCPRLELTNLICQECLKNDDDEYKLYKDKYSNIYICENCKEITRRTI